MLVGGLAWWIALSERRPTMLPPVSPLPRLTVRGDEIVTAGGKVVELRGLSIADPVAMEQEGHFTAGEFRHIHRLWHADIVRIPVHPQSWEATDGHSYIRRYLIPAVVWCEREGMYVLIDWHGIGNPIYGSVPTSVDDTAVAHSYPQTREFWQMVAAAFGDRPSVLYELFNEPAQIEWLSWRAVAEELIDIVAASAPNSLKVVGGVDFGRVLDGALSAPVRRSHVVYSSHIYPLHEAYWDNLISIAARFPVLVTEWGFTPGGFGPTDGDVDGYGKPFVSLMDDHDISWIAWVYHPKWEPNLLKSWEQPSAPYGEFIQQVLTQE